MSLSRLKQALLRSDKLKTQDRVKLLGLHDDLESAKLRLDDKRKQNKKDPSIDFGPEMLEVARKSLAFQKQIELYGIIQKKSVTKLFINLREAMEEIIENKGNPSLEEQALSKALTAAKSIAVKDDGLLPLLRDTVLTLRAEEAPFNQFTQDEKISIIEANYNEWSYEAPQLTVEEIFKGIEDPILSDLIRKLDMEVRNDKELEAKEGRFVNVTLRIESVARINEAYSNCFASVQEKLDKYPNRKFEDVLNESEPFKQLIKAIRGLNPRVVKSDNKMLKEEANHWKLMYENFRLQKLFRAHLPVILRGMIDQEFPSVVIKDLKDGNKTIRKLNQLLAELSVLPLSADTDKLKKQMKGYLKSLNINFDDARVNELFNRFNKRDLSDLQRTEAVQKFLDFLMDVSKTRHPSLEQRQVLSSYLDLLDIYLPPNTFNRFMEFIYISDVNMSKEVKEQVHNSNMKNELYAVFDAIRNIRNDKDKSPNVLKRELRASLVALGQNPLDADLDKLVFHFRGPRTSIMPPPLPIQPLSPTVTRSLSSSSGSAGFFGHSPSSLGQLNPLSPRSPLSNSVEDESDEDIFRRNSTSSLFNSPTRGRSDLPPLPPPKPAKLPDEDLLEAAEKRKQRTPVPPPLPRGKMK